MSSLIIKVTFFGNYSSTASGPPSLTREGFFVPFLHTRRGVCGDRLFSAGASLRPTGLCVPSVHRRGGFHIRPWCIRRSFVLGVRIRYQNNTPSNSVAPVRFAIDIMKVLRSPMSTLFSNTHLVSFAPMDICLPISTSNSVKTSATT